MNALFYTCRRPDAGHFCNGLNNQTATHKPSAIAGKLSY